MDNKNTMSRLLIGLALLTSVGAQAECYTRSSTVSKLTSSIEQIADVDRRVLPEGNGKNLCRITFRAYINGNGTLLRVRKLAVSMTVWILSVPRH